jgi:hypothetical protein
MGARNVLVYDENYLCALAGIGHRSRRRAGHSNVVSRRLSPSRRG